MGEAEITAQHAQVELLQIWLRRLRDAQLSHYAAAEQAAFRHLAIGLPAATFSAIVGTTVFTALDSSQSSGTLDIRIQVAIGLVSILTAILTGCQTFLRFSDKAEMHRVAATKYASLRRIIEQYLTFPNTISVQAIDTLRTEIDKLAELAPNVPVSLFDKIVKRNEKYFIPKTQMK